LILPKNLLPLSLPLMPLPRLLRQTPLLQPRRGSLMLVMQP